ncbi:MAG: SH3 domain-containing protein [Bacteroidaceae bacterium]|nr:SH3 domain-containing protein [Bacteroidaceae bacterium]
MKKILLLLCLVLSPFARLSAESLEQLNALADSAYKAEQYDEAVALYSQVADSVRSAAVYYNLGCAYYRVDDIAHSILWLERALQLDASDEDIRFNLEFVRGKTIDRITPRHEMFFVSFYRSLVNSMSLNGWGVFSLTCFVVMLLALLIFIYSRPMLWRKVGFACSILFFLLTILGNVCGYQQQYYNAHRSSGVITASSVSVKSTPSDSGNDLFVLHEGTTVEIQDDTMNEWCEVRIADGKVGWLRKSTMETI